MIAATTVAFLALTAGIAAAEPPAPLDRQRVADNPDFHVQGEYQAHGWGMHVMALGEGAFRAMLFRGGLPGDGWDRSEAVVLKGETDSGTTTLTGESATRAVIADAALRLEHDGRSILLERTMRTSPALSTPPPDDAVVLFDGSSVDAFEDGASMTDDGLLREGATTRQAFGDHRLHLEYLLGFEPEARDMARANSGVYLLGRYEVQIVDSFGMPATERLNAAVFGIAPPRVPAGLPPLRWQTLDITFTAPRFNDAGEKTQDARMTVHHNDVLVHEDVAVPGPTNAALFDDDAAEGPVYIQDHSNPVRFRNVWVQPLEGGDGSN